MAVSLLLQSVAGGGCVLLQSSPVRVAGLQYHRPVGGGQLLLPAPTQASADGGDSIQLHALPRHHFPQHLHFRLLPRDSSGGHFVGHDTLVPQSDFDLLPLSGGFHAGDASHEPHSVPSTAS